MAQDSVKIIELKQISNQVINANTYTAVNPAGLTEACFLIRITNYNDNLVLVSIDGTTDQEVVLANSILELPVQTNSQPNAKVALFPLGTIIYVKGIVPLAAGNILVSGYYV